MRSWILAVLLVACGDASPSSLDAAVDAPGSDAPKDAQVNASYAAYATIGGMDRIRITKSTGPTCFVIGLVSPAAGGNDIVLPAGWVEEFAEARQPAAACNPSYVGPVANTHVASARSGMIAWSGMPPSTIDSVQVTLTFANNPAWCPPSESLTATSLAVQ